MHDKVLIIDDRPGDRKKLTEALNAVGLGKEVVPAKSIKDARRLLQLAQTKHDPLQFPVAVISDLQTKESEDLDDGVKFLHEIVRDARQAGTGLWTVLASNRPDLLRKEMANLSDPCVPSKIVEKRDNWPAECAEFVRPLFEGIPAAAGQKEAFVSQTDVGNDAGRPSGASVSRLAGRRQSKELAISDRLFLYSSGESISTSDCPQCPAIGLPVGVQMRAAPRRPILMYRGDFHVIEGPHTKWLAQLLLRWRTLSALGMRKFPIGLLTTNTENQEQPEIGGPSHPTFHSALGDFRRSLHPDRMPEQLRLRHVVRASWIPTFDAIKNPLFEIEAPSESWTSFLARLNFWLDDDDVESFAAWGRWRETHQDAASLMRRGTPDVSAKPGIVRGTGGGQQNRPG